MRCERVNDTRRATAEGRCRRSCHEGERMMAGERGGREGRATLTARLALRSHALCRHGLRRQRALPPGVLPPNAILRQESCRQEPDVGGSPATAGGEVGGSRLFSPRKPPTSGFRRQGHDSGSQRQGAAPASGGGGVTEARCPGGFGAASHGVASYSAASPSATSTATYAVVAPTASQSAPRMRSGCQWLRSAPPS